MLKRITHFTDRAWGYCSPTSRRLEKECRQQLASARTLCLFVGHDRSGHSIIGHLLNQHPEAAIAHEYDLMEKLNARGAGRVYQLLNEMRLHALETQNRDLQSTGYLFRQLNFGPADTNSISVLGDKMANSLSDMLSKRGLGFLRPLENTGRNMKFIFVVRNPYDVISTKLMRDVYCYSSPLFTERLHDIRIDEIAEILKSEDHYRVKLNNRLSIYIELYFQRARSVKVLMECRRWPLLPIHHREFVAAPREQLQKLLEFLELKEPPGYLDAAAEQVRPTPRSRHLIDGLWGDDIRTEVAEQMRRFDFLADYSFESD